MRFFIVVPTRDSAAHVGRCLAGLLELQPGPFDLHVHVQDCGSSDGTPEVVEAWQQRVVRREVPDHSRRRLTFASEPDAGLYDAVGRAFDGEGDDPGLVMTWLGSDDLLLPGALVTVMDALERFGTIRWLTGQPQIVDSRGGWRTGWRIGGYARRDLRLGLHDGRAHPFVMQEGTFWRASLYRQAGGLRRDLRLAGDFDLWRRFARTDDLVTWSSPLALFTQRPGQSSSDLASYYREVDRSLAEDPVTGSLESLLLSGEARRDARRSLVERYPGADYVFTDGGRTFIPLEGMEAFGASGDPSGSGGTALRIVGPIARLRLPVLESGGTYQVALRVRSGRTRQMLVIRSGDAELFRGPVEHQGGDQADVITLRHRFPGREPVLTLEIGQPPDPPRNSGWLDRLRAGLRKGSFTCGVSIEDLAIQRMQEASTGPEGPTQPGTLPRIA